MSLNKITKTVDNLAKAVRRQFGDESGVQITDEDIIRWTNNGQDEVVGKNKVLKGKALIDAVPGQADYTLPEVDIAAIESIHFNNVPIRGVPYPELESIMQEYSSVASTQTGQPAIWYEWAGTVTFWPAPSTSDKITLLYTKAPTQVTTLSDTLSIPDKYFNTLVQYVLAQAYEMDEDWNATDYKTQQFEAGLSAAADDERTTQMLTYPSISMVVDY